MTTEQLLTELGIPFAPPGSHHHVGPSFYGVDCPNCSPRSSKFKAGLPASGPFTVVCWSCGKLPLARTLAAASGRPVASIISLLRDAGWGKGNLPYADEKPRETGSYSPPEGLKPLASLPLHKKYLEGRGFDLDYLDKVWGVSEGLTLHQRLAWRVFIPIADPSGRAVSWTTRAVSDAAERRYLTAEPEQEALPSKSLLYGEPHLRHVAVVVEGPTDAWRVGPGAVATLGTSFTQAQLLRLSKYPLRVVAYDREEAAQAAAEKLCEALAPFAGRTVRVELSAGDPGSATEKEISRLRRKYLGG